MAELSLPTLSDAFVAHVAELSRSRLGLAHLAGSRLSHAVTDISHTYTRERSAMGDLQGDDAVHSARLQFFLPRDLLKLHGPLAELASIGALPSARAGLWRVLDLGAGLGSSSLGVARFAALRGSAERLHVTALDSDAEALWLFNELAQDLQTLPGVPTIVQTREHDFTKSALPSSVGGPFELIVLGLVLNELATALSPSELAARMVAYAELLTDDGCVIIVEPALRETSRALHRVRDVLAARDAAPYVFAPCLHNAACPMLTRERDFCHERIMCELPSTLAQLAASAGLRERDLTYSYLTLHRQRRSLRELAGPNAWPFRVVSGQLATKGKREIWLCGPSGAPRAQRLDRHRSPHNEAFEAAERGSIATLDDAAAGSLVRVDKDAQVELVQRWVRR